jgi:hypothetical protein
MQKKITYKTLLSLGKSLTHLVVSSEGASSVLLRKVKFKETAKLIRLMQPINLKFKGIKDKQKQFIKT